MGPKVHANVCKRQNYKKWVKNVFLTLTFLIKNCDPFKNSEVQLKKTNFIYTIYLHINLSHMWNAHPTCEFLSCASLFSGSDSLIKTHNKFYGL